MLNGDLITHLFT